VVVVVVDMADMVAATVEDMEGVMVEGWEAMAAWDHPTEAAMAAEG